MTANTTLYLDGKTAYISRYGIASRRVKKADFESLINIGEDLTVIVCRDTVAKYAKRIGLLGYILTSKETYDMYTYQLFK